MHLKIIKEEISHYKKIFGLKKKTINLFCDLIFINE
jgi:hypothetical protein